jgi:hypothetical protein
MTIGSLHDPTYAQSNALEVDCECGDLDVMMHREELCKRC